jgi:hypothetical protein
MSTQKNYETGLLYLTHLVSLEDGIEDESEMLALEKIKVIEGISDETYNEFMEDKDALAKNDLYQTALDALRECKPDQVMRVFAWIFAMIEVDGHIHVREARFMMYIIKAFDLSLEKVEKVFQSLPSLK